MIQVYVITLINAKKRQEWIAGQLNRLGIPFEFIFGIDGRKLTVNELDECYDSARAKSFEGEMTPGEIGCALSHRLAYKIIVERKVERAIILEDDISLDENFNDILCFFSYLKPQNMVIKIDRFRWSGGGI